MVAAELQARPAVLLKLVDRRAALADDRSDGRVADEKLQAACARGICDGEPAQSAMGAGAHSTSVALASKRASDRCGQTRAAARVRTQKESEYRRSGPSLSAPIPPRAPRARCLQATNAPLCCCSPAAAPASACGASIAAVSSAGGAALAASTSIPPSIRGAHARRRACPPTLPSLPPPLQRTRPASPRSSPGSLPPPLLRSSQAGRDRAPRSASTPCGAGGRVRSHTSRCLRRPLSAKRKTNE